MGLDTFGSDGWDGKGCAGSVRRKIHSRNQLSSSTRDLPKGYREPIDPSRNFAGHSRADAEIPHMRTSWSQITRPSAFRQIVPCDVESGGVGGASTAEARITAANKDFYRQFAEKYDRYESCVCNAHLQKILEADLDKI